MIVRRRLTVTATPQSEPAKPPRPPSSVGLAPTVLRHPPIQHRGQHDPGRFTVFEFAVAAAIIATARAAVAQARHTSAWQAGQAAVAQEKADHIARQQDAIRHSTVPDQPELSAAGAAGYREGREAFDKEQAGAPVRVPISAAMLLRTAGLPRNTRNTSLLPAALDRLMRGVRCGREDLPPVLSATVSKRALVVERRWLLDSRFDTVPLPVPTKGGGSVVLALYLFLHSIDRGPRRFVSVAMRTLCQRIGIATDRRAEATRTLDAALAAVNRHLAGLGLPTSFRIVSIEEGTRIRFVAETKAAQTGEANVDRDDDEAEEARRYFAMCPDDTPAEGDVDRMKQHRHRLRLEREEAERVRFGEMLAAKLRAGTKSG